MEVENLDIKSFLLDKGCKIQQSGGELQIIASWRGGQKFSVSVNPRTGAFFDFVDASGGSFEKLNSLLGGSEILEPNYSFSNTDWVDELKLPKIFDKSILNDLTKDYSYWERRGISEQTCQLFGGGVATESTPKLAGRFVTPIFNSGGQIEGFSARYVGPNKNISKQKLIGSKKTWAYPLFLSKDSIVDSKTAVLIEGLADAYSCVECGVNNILVMFGVKLSQKIINTLISLSVRNLIICTNWDENGVGQRAAQDIKNQLSAFWDSDNIEVRLPAPFNDINSALLDKNGGPEFIRNLLK